MPHLPQLHEGHAPITLHELFRDAVDRFDDWDDGSDEPVVMFQGDAVPISAVFAHMRDCTDILPNNLLGAIKERLTRPWTGTTPLDEMSVSTAARIMFVLSRKRQLRHGSGDLAAFLRRMDRKRSPVSTAQGEESGVAKTA